MRCGWIGKEDPYPWSHLFKQLAHCKRCRVQLPPEVLADEDQYWAYYWRHYQQLYGAYLAGPVREIFPLCSHHQLAHCVFHSDQALALLCQQPGIAAGHSPIVYGHQSRGVRQRQILANGVARRLPP